MSSLLDKNVQSSELKTCWGLILQDYSPWDDSPGSNLWNLEIGEIPVTFKNTWINPSYRWKSSKYTAICSARRSRIKHNQLYNSNVT